MMGSERKKKTRMTDDGRIRLMTLWFFQDSMVLIRSTKVSEGWTQHSTFFSDTLSYSSCFEMNKWTSIFHHSWGFTVALSLSPSLHLANIKFNGTTFRLKNSIKKFLPSWKVQWQPRCEIWKSEFASIPVAINIFFRPRKSVSEEENVRWNHFRYLWNINFNFSYSTDRERCFPMPGKKFFRPRTSLTLANKSRPSSEKHLKLITR